jgi:hypothetical protein
LADEAKRKGDYEQLSTTERERAAKADQARKDAEDKAVRIARRAEFIGRASGKVNDPSAAYTLAAAAGLVDFEVDDEGQAKDPKKVDEIVVEILKRHEFLKPNRNFGDSRDGQPPGAPMDRSKMSARDMLRAGYDQGGRS